MVRLLVLVAFLITVCACSFSQVSSMKITTIGEYEDLIKYYRYYKQDSAVYFSHKALAFARQQKDSNGIASILVQMGMIDDNRGEFDSSWQKYNQALALFKRSHSKKGIASVMIRMGVVELRNGKYDNAVKYFLQALEISEQAGDKPGVLEANYSISWAHLDRHNYKVALQYLKTAERLNDSLPFSNISLNIFNHLGVLYKETGELTKAQHYLEKGVRLSDKVEYQGLNITLINNLASVYSKQGSKEKAVKLQKEALQRSRALGNYLRELQVLYGLARTYAQDDLPRAIDYLQQAIALAKQKGAYNQEMRYLRAITPWYVKQGDYKDAFLMKEREKFLSDSFLQKSMSQNIASLKAEYELSKSNARIKELDLLNNKRRLELKNASLLHYVTFGGIVLLLIILGLLYNQYWVKQRNNQEISIKNQALQHLLEEKEWLVKEIHHRVKNNLHTVMSLLESQSVYLRDEALLAIQNSKHRIYAMSLIHQKLYQVDHMTNVELSVYLPELINYLQDSFDVGKYIQFRSAIEKMEVDIAIAIPIGLIVNEAITNSIKHAFSAREQNMINICLTKTDRNTILLSVADNGVGMPETDNRKKDSLGFKLMRGLTDDLHGSFTVENRNGTTISVEFPAGFFPHEVIKNAAARPMEVYA
ncbi:tetratricopeptide repeat-containing sensor histidine kinase [Longitalea luteola]|uniref:tetratricopeptide repeat-containing sensor histidine kinase n=1 Tax=Longitalea luteola TaxID=2812563 RepID=UPI001A960DAF|nr:tetratricopeptide repeat protein [Longitalea luteola]